MFKHRPVLSAPPTDVHSLWEIPEHENEPEAVFHVPIPPKRLHALCGDVCLGHKDKAEFQFPPRYEQMLCGVMVALHKDKTVFQVPPAFVQRLDG